MTPSKAGLDLIKSFEGCKLTAYPDPGTGGDPWTVGWGSTGPDIKRGTTWTQAQADERFAADAGKFAVGVWARLANAPTTQNQFDALVSLAYNIGTGNLASSTLLRMHKAGDYEGVAGQFIRWNKADGKPMAGLTRRREAEAAMYRGWA
jgi:lysozyme